MDWIQVTQNRDQWRALFRTAMKLRVPQNVGKFLSLRDWRLLKKGSAPQSSLISAWFVITTLRDRVTSPSLEIRFIHSRIRSRHTQITECVKLFWRVLTISRSYSCWSVVWAVQFCTVYGIWEKLQGTWAGVQDYYFLLQLWQETHLYSQIRLHNAIPRNMDGISGNVLFEYT
jgi:hypothetical protein